MENVVLTSPAASRRAREALARALGRFPAAIEEAAGQLRSQDLERIAARDGVRWIVVVDGDAVPAPDAFGALQRAFDGGATIVGGRALVGASQRLGAMFAPIRSGPDPFELLPLHALQTNRPFADLVRGDVDVPARGVFVVAADFVTSVAGAELDPDTLFLDLAVYARAAGRTTVCEPSLTFTADEDSPAVRAKLGDLRRFAGVGSWAPGGLHRDPVRMRAAYVTREVRVMSSVRGYARRPYPPCDILVVAQDEMARARAQRRAAAIVNGGTITACGSGDGDSVRRALARTSDRYLLVCDAAALPERTDFEALAERLERNGRTALVFSGTPDLPGAALFHCGRIAGGASFSGETVNGVIAAAIAALPVQRLFAAGAGTEIVPDPLPALPAAKTLDVVFVAASKPTATQQTIQAIMGETFSGSTTVVYPAGQTTMERMLTPFTTLKLAPDATDVQLAAALNRALGATTADCIAVIRDDVQIPHGVLERLADAFRRVARLGAAVPRVGGSDRPESIPDLGYRNSAEMQSIAERRYEIFARESLLLDFATAPVIMIGREALEAIGGFDETFGFTRCGVEDFSRRLRAANFLLVRCDDAYAHLFPQAEAGSYIGELDDEPHLRAALDKRWSARTDFVPERDFVGLRRDEAVVPAAVAAERLRILVPLRDRADWESARPLIVEFAEAFRVHDPVDLLIGIQGTTFDFHAALAAMREILFATGVPMEQTLNISIDYISDSAEWRAAGSRNAQLPGLSRDAFAGVPVVTGSESVRALLATIGA